MSKLETTECDRLFDGPVFVAKHGQPGKVVWFFCDTSGNLAEFFKNCGERRILATPSKFHSALPLKELRWTVAGRKPCPRVFYITRYNDDSYKIRSYLGGVLNLPKLDFNHSNLDVSDQIVAYGHDAFCGPLGKVMDSLQARKYYDDSVSSESGSEVDATVKFMYGGKEFEMDKDFSSVSVVKQGQTLLAALAAHVTPEGVIF